MPEWFNPLYAKYGKVTFVSSAPWRKLYLDAWSQPGGLSHSPFDKEIVEPYTGLVEVDDYIEDIQLKQMR
jgi:alpha-L-fucosidase